METAFLVLGPESSGTRLTTKIMKSGGCAGCDEHIQPFDKSGPPQDRPIVWRRSVPHGSHLPSLSDLVGRAGRRKYMVLVPVRDAAAIAASQMRKQPYHCTYSEALNSIEGAYRHIFGQVCVTGLSFELVSYEALILHPEESQRALWERFGLPGGTPVTVTDQNAKHYMAA